MRTFSERIHTAVVVNVVDVVDVGYVGNIIHSNDVHPVSSAAVPREEAVARPAGQPAHTAEAAAESEANVNAPTSSAESEE